MKGTVKWYNETKGFGFIEDEDGQDYFVSHKNINSDKSFESLKTLEECQSVTFDTFKGPKGLEAFNVTVLSEESSAKKEISLESIISSQKNEIENLNRIIGDLKVSRDQQVKSKDYFVEQNKNLNEQIKSLELALLRILSDKYKDK